MPNRAQALIDQTSQLLPRIKITELLMDVDDWTGFSRPFTHLKQGAEAKERTLLLSAILGDADNVGLTKMAESSHGLNYAKLSWLQTWQIHDETYSAALAELLNHQYRHGFAAHWDNGTTLFSDSQSFRADGRGRRTGHVNPKCGSEPGRPFYTHNSDQYALFSTRVVNVGVRDTIYVLDGLLYHESDLRIE